MTYSLGNISTTQFYDRNKARMGALSSRVDELQTQLATGKKLAAPSSDSAAYQRLRSMAKDAASDSAYAGNLKLAASGLDQADTTLTAINTQIQRASELAIQARNGTQSDQTRAVIAAEIDAIGESLASLANRRDARGQYLFGGINGEAGATPEPGGGYTLATTTGASIPIGDGEAVQTGEAAARVFKVGDGDVFQLLATLSAALKEPGTDDAAMGTAIDDLAAAGTQVSTVQASLGARAARVEMEQTRLADTGVEREADRIGIEGMDEKDIAAAVVEMQKTMTILSATQASFSKLQALSLFSYLR
ncbi:flagellin [Sphingomonas rubra]|uniref:Flagellin n=1 Tax=Sphingomonas rubra TaxID=634430 RepID=A0A1I5UIX8_9SPHN|nr:flagellin [Sphingomonas rubra]SFP95243.1 flagellar hook-associated protein 3 FlgL [Sphingomonas rubra]